MPHQYINPCHFPLPNNTHVSAPSIAGAVTGAPHRHLPPHLRHVPQLAYATNSKWNATLGRNSAIERPVTFDSPGSVGVRMIYLHPNEAHLATVLQGANDPVVLSNRAVNITFRILVRVLRRVSLRRD
jgi:hypothetical protein